MKKRLFCMLLVLSMAATLAACGGGGETPGGQNTEAPSQSGADETAGYSFAVSKANGYIVAIGDNMAGVLTALGEPAS